MSADDLAMPAREAMVKHVVESLDRYWLGHGEALLKLPVSRVPIARVELPLKLVSVSLPEWGKKWGVKGEILVPIDSVSGSTYCWENVDWWTACFLMMECWHERVFESENGPIQSYSFRLVDWDVRAWDRAWVNRIGLFLREWAFLGKEAPKLPRCEVILTHDVDAIRKTLAIRLKQGLFGVFNGLRALREGRFRRARERISKAISFAAGFDDWWTLGRMVEEQKKLGLRSVFHFAADDRSKTIKRWLFDPSYRLTEPRLQRIFQLLVKGGWTVGLHPSFDSWNRADLLRAQKRSLESASGSEVSWNRQHWLRFSFADTWVGLESAGVKVDSTLMFNDRPGFRGSLAGRWHPWEGRRNTPLGLEAVSSILMDSHLYDYSDLNDEERRIEIGRWVDEVEEVRGIAAVLWHPQTLTDDYGWSVGYKLLLERLASKGRDVTEKNA